MWTDHLQAVLRTASFSDIPDMHKVRLSVNENELSDPARITEAAYLPFVEAGSAWIAEVGGKVAGFAALDASRGVVWALFVDPAAEGRGVGRSLHDRMLHWAAERGLVRLSLSTAPGTRAERFYTKAGWAREGLTSAGEVRFSRNLPSAVQRHE